MSFFENINEIFNCGDRDEKFAKFRQFYAKYKNGEFDLSDDGKIEPLSVLSYAKFCNVVQMRDMPKPHKDDKQKAFLHSIAHIEYSAIDIALDAAYRFRGLPKAYYDDWLEVADDEIRHFEMIEAYMAKFGVKYGDFTVHDGLFVALNMTANCLLERMAVLPRFMEANGLDANAFMLEKLKSDKTQGALREILQVILNEEISHVSKGDRWFKFECDRLNIDPGEYINIVLKFYPNSFAKSRQLNVRARLQSGFSMIEIEAIRQISQNLADTKANI